VSENARSAPAVDRLLTLSDVRDVLGYSEKSVRRLVADGRLPTVRLVERGRMRFRASDVRRLIDDAVTGEPTT
jgi:excisionase family DNA binding protein